MMRRTLPLIATLAALVALLPAVPAGASTMDAIARDCQRYTAGLLSRTYTKAQLRNAKNNLPGDALEYTDCYDQINQALLDTPGGGSHGGGSANGSQGDGGGGTNLAGGGGDGTSGGGAAGAPAAVAHVGTKQPVELGGAVVSPGTIPALGQDAHTLPTPLLVFLVLLGLGALVPAATTIVRRVITRRRA
jgi:hypothetical protein